MELESQDAFSFKIFFAFIKDFTHQLAIDLVGEMIALRMDFKRVTDGSEAPENWSSFIYATPTPQQQY